MILTKEQQEKIVEQYFQDKHNISECVGFIDDINPTIELINRTAPEPDPVLTIPVITNHIEKAPDR